jgi:hypothetical protein
VTKASSKKLLLTRVAEAERDMRLFAKHASYHDALDCQRRGLGLLEAALALGLISPEESDKRRKDLTWSVEVRA